MLRRRPAPAFSVLAELLVAIRGDDGAWAVTDAVDGGVADRGGGRGSYRVIDINAGQILQRAHSTPGFARARASAEPSENLAPFILIAVVTRAREGERRITAIDLLDLLEPAVWCCAAGRRRRFPF